MFVNRYKFNAEPMIGPRASRGTINGQDRIACVVGFLPNVHIRNVSRQEVSITSDSAGGQLRRAFALIVAVVSNTNLNGGPLPV
jgi:hypothetical protein